MRYRQPAQLLLLTLALLTPLAEAGTPAKAPKADALSHALRLLETSQTAGMVRGGLREGFKEKQISPVISSCIINRLDSATINRLMAPTLAKHLSAADIRELTSFFQSWQGVRLASAMASGEKASFMAELDSKSMRNYFDTHPATNTAFGNWGQKINDIMQPVADYGKKLATTDCLPDPTPEDLAQVITPPEQLDAYEQLLYVVTYGIDTPSILKGLLPASSSKAQYEELSACVSSHFDKLDYTKTVAVGLHSQLDPEEAAELMAFFSSGSGQYLLGLLMERKREAALSAESQERILGYFKMHPKVLPPLERFQRTKAEGKDWGATERLSYLTRLIDQHCTEFVSGAKPVAAQ